MKLIKEAKRLQQLAGITEITINKPGENNTKALGVLFHKDNDGDYVWDHDAMAALIKKMGYEDWFELEKEITHYTSPGDEDEMDTFKQQTGNPNLQLDDLTIGMYKEKIRNEFLMSILIKIGRDQGKLGGIKKQLFDIAENLKEIKEFRNAKIIFDVDPA
jgi:hypothetical protein